jgi:cellulose 1,4-beta-cellobiosidase
VQWDAVADATSYNLYWAEALPLTKQSATLIAGAVSPYKHTGLSNGKLLYYAVAARNNIGESDLSAAIGAMPVAAVPVPVAPAQLNASAGDTSVALTWSTVTGADTYSIYWSKATPVVVGAAGVTKIDKLTATSYTHVGLTNGDRYYYIVAAVNATVKARRPPKSRRCRNFLRQVRR